MVFSSKEEQHPPPERWQSSQRHSFSRSCWINTCSMRVWWIGLVHTHEHALSDCLFVHSQMYARVSTNIVHTHLEASVAHDAPAHVAPRECIAACVAERLVAALTQRINLSNVQAGEVAVVPAAKIDAGDLSLPWQIIHLKLTKKNLI